MHRVLTLAALAAVLVVVGCGSGNDSETSAGAPAKMSGAVGVKHVDGVGDVLVDSSGLALYSPDQESAGKISCTGKCESFWLPLQSGSSTPPVADGVGKLAVVKRPDGTRQISVGSKPLYTFVQDAPGKITGDGFKDDFGGTSFTWHVVLADGGSSSASSSSSGGGYGY